MANKYTGLGFVLKMNSSAIAGIRDMSHSEASGEAVDVTALDDLSSSDRYLRKSGGTVDPGALALDLVYDPDDLTQQALQTALDSGSSQSFEVVYPTTTISETFGGIVNGKGVEIPLGQRVGCSIRIDKSGKPFNLST